jgi:hypothetical protein
MQLEEMLLRILLYAQAAPQLGSFALLSFEECAPSEIIISRPHIQMRPFILRPVTAAARAPRSPFALAMRRRQILRARARLWKFFNPVFLHFGWRFYAANFA